MKDQLATDEVITADSKKPRANFTVTQTDYQRTYVLVPYLWILETPSVYNIVPVTMKLVEISLVKWITRLTCNGWKMADIVAKFGFFKDNALSPLQFCIHLDPGS